ncbi:hypothetical protein B0A50_06563 [Salinomyces thailandicus]|uniref:Ketoreductase domain-containing protein n=1 Tax=Salinomyces thailandicus TaxID=706561 RepID=A0A4U0TRT4_9PEZI|nr:hypothetical protein B0A50_06563 [Salinomyces thailandica]
MSFSLLQPTRSDVYPFIDPTQNLKNVAAGKTVLVTGAGTGIGRAIASSFAQAGAAKLIIAARRLGPLQETQSSIAAVAPNCEVHIASGTDVADQTSVENLFANLSSPPDIVVSNAGISGVCANIADTDPETWWKDFDVNLRGTYLVARTYIRQLRATGVKKPARIINVTSNASWRYYPGRASYAASKLGVNSLSEYIDRDEVEVGSGVRCVALHPGGVDTELAASLPEEVRRRILVDKPELAGGTAVYLSSARADFLMGRFVSSTWDMEALEKCEGRVVEGDLLKSRVLGVA